MTTAPELPTPANSQTVREFSTIGPCLRLGELVRKTARFYVYRRWGGADRHDDKESRISIRTEAHYSPAHVVPCPSCRDHPKTQYPDGYMD